MTRPWLAEDGGLVRIRLVGGRITARQLAALSQVSRRFGDGDLHLTGRANLQVRGLPVIDAALPPPVRAAFVATGLVPSLGHDLARNVMASPATGLFGGRTDLRESVAALDAAILADSSLAGLPGRFLFVLDDGRGDVAGLRCDLGWVALDEHTVQLRHGDAWGRVVPLADAPAALLDLARRFVELRGTAPAAAWHVRELPLPLDQIQAREPRADVHQAPLGFGEVGPWLHLEAPVLTASLLDSLNLPPDDDVVVTPWRGLLIPTDPSRKG